MDGKWWEKVLNLMPWFSSFIAGRELFSKIVNGNLSANDPDKKKKKRY